MQASPTAKLLKWGCSTQSVSHNGSGIDRGYPTRTPNTNKPLSTAELRSKRRGVRITARMHANRSWTANTASTQRHLNMLIQKMHTQAFSVCPVVYLCVHQILKWTVCGGLESGAALWSGRQAGFQEWLVDWGQLKGQFDPIFTLMAQLTDFLPLSGPQAGVTQICTCTVVVLIYVWSTSASVNIHIIPVRVHSCTSGHTMDDCCRWWQRVCVHVVKSERKGN